MYFIGVISNKDYEKIEKELYKHLNEKEFTIINVTDENILNIRNVKFDVMLITNANQISKENNIILKKIISNSKYLVINTDIYVDLEIIEELETNVITYRF